MQDIINTMIYYINNHHISIDLVIMSSLCIMMTCLLISILRIQLDYYLSKHTNKCSYENEKGEEVIVN
jgi:hypothetical protein